MSSILDHPLKPWKCNTYFFRQEPETKCSTLSNQVCSVVRNCASRKLFSEQCSHIRHKQVTDTICKQVPNAVCKPVKKQKCENVPVVTCRWGNVIRMSLYPLYTALVQVFILIGKSPSPSVKLCPTKSANWYIPMTSSSCRLKFFPDQVKDSVCTKIPQETCSADSKKECQDFPVMTCRCIIVMLPLNI